MTRFATPANVRIYYVVQSERKCRLTRDEDHLQVQMLNVNHFNFSPLILWKAYNTLHVLYAQESCYGSIKGAVVN